jgi:hypothetical protein
VCYRHFALDLSTCTLLGVSGALTPCESLFVIALQIAIMQRENIFLEHTTD